MTNRIDEPHFLFFYLAVVNKVISFCDQHCRFIISSDFREFQSAVASVAVSGSSSVVSFYYINGSTVFRYLLKAPEMFRLLP